MNNSVNGLRSKIILVYIKFIVIYSLSWHGGFGSNFLAEARALSGLVAFCVFLGIQSISIFGDSKSLIDHVNDLGLINCPHLLGWLSRISFFSNLINRITFQHIPCSADT